MAFTYFLHGFTVLLPISKPANFTSSLAKWNLSGLRVMPWRPHVSSHRTPGKSILLSSLTIGGCHLYILSC